MTTLDPDLTVYDLASALLAAVEDRYPTTGDHALPARRYVSDGLPAHDICDDGSCGQVTVWISRVFPTTGDPTVEAPVAVRFEAGRAVEAQIEVVRRVPAIGDDGDAMVPTPAEIEASAALVLADAEMVPQAIRVAQREGDLPGCRAVVFAGWTSLGPQGGVGGGRVTMRLAVD